MRNPSRQPAVPAKLWRWRLLRIGMRGLACYLVVVLLLSSLQRQLMYVPSRAESLPVTLTGLRGEDVVVPTTDGLELHGWHLLPRRSVSEKQGTGNPAEFDHALAEGRDPVILYFPGNGGHRQYRTLDFQVLTTLPAHVIAFDYRGYGENPGQPTEDLLAADALSMWNYVVETRHVSPERVLLYGESLGGGVATRLAAELCLAKTPPGGLILCSTFSSMVDAASYHYPWLPVRLVLKDRFPSIDHMRSVTCPLLMFHGQQDTVVPYTMGRRLFAAAPEHSLGGVAKTFVELPTANHNDILMTEPQRYEAGLAEFVTRLRSAP